MSRCWRIVTVLVVAGLLVACADDSATPDDRRFANEPSTEVPEATSPPQTPVASAPTPLPQASPESLLDAQDAPGFIFLLLDGSIDVIDAAGSEPPRRIIAPDSRRFVAIARSPVDERVAALTMPVTETADARAEVAIYDSEGQMVNGWSDLPSATGGIATPGPDAVPVPPPSISWGPDANRLLVATGGSDLVSLDIDGEASVLPVPSPVQQVVHAAWSPQDDQIALLAPNADGSAAIWVFSPYVDGVSMRQVAPPNADASNLGSVIEFAWLPDGSGLAYILAGDTGAGEAGGQLYTINIKLGIKLLVATPGRGGPAAQIVDFALSPDGRAIAYTIAIPDGEQWQFHSLWVRSVQARAVYGVPAGNPERIERLWWAGSGIAWQQQAGGTLQIVAQMAGESPVTVFTAGPAGESPIGATPDAATPVASTPAATPISATPVQATPDRATPAT